MTNLSSNAPSLSLSQIGVFGDKQSFRICFLEKPPTGDESTQPARPGTG